MTLLKGKSAYWNKTPATNDSGKQLTTANVDVSWAEGHKIVGCTDGVGGDIDTKGDDDQANGAKSGSSTTTMGAIFHPQADDLDRVPDD